MLGTWGEWISGIGALLAVTASVVMFVLERRRTKREGEEIQRAEELRQQQALAQGVAWSYEFTGESRRPVRPVEGSPIRVRVFNQSQYPIFTVKLAIVWESHPFDGHPGGLVPSPWDDLADVVPAGPPFEAESAVMETEGSLWLLFTDARARRWGRSEWGRLVDLGPARDYPTYEIEPLGEVRPNEPTQ